MKIEGHQIATNILKNLQIKVSKLKVIGIVPHFVIILINKDPASKVYVKQKILTANKIGIKTSFLQYPISISQKQLLDKLNDLNHLTSVHGIIVQRPLPRHIDTQVIIEAIDPKKDIDGFHPVTSFQSPLAQAVLKILESIFGHLRGGVAPAAHLEGEFHQWLKSKKIVIFGKGETGGKPVIDMLKKIGINPLIIDSKTPNPPNLTKSADIIISAVGRQNLVKPEMIKKGSILISIGLSKGKDAKLHGDYDEEKIKNLASFYTPTPGGVGPVNVAMLLKNLISNLKS